jgi:poly [ADP-ribose] polymerase
MMKEYEVSGIFKVQRKGEAEMIQAFKEIPNHYLLFHGSTMSNFIGIMKQGLRIAPPEAPTTGFMFGKGVYFADMF